MKRIKILANRRYDLLKKEIRFVALGVLFILMHLCVKATPVDSSLAKNIALNFYRNVTTRTSRSMANPSIAYIGQSVRQVDSRNVTRLLYYVVNIGNNAYVIVAADDRVSPVLAYSTTSAFDGNMMPPGMAFLMDEYRQQIELLCEGSEEPAPAVTSAWHDLRHPSYHHSRSIVVEPLLTTKWNQNQYYNALCPVEPHSASGHAVAGCTSVAMAQILHYWRYPIHGTGSHSYVADNSQLGIGYGNYGTLTADFSATTYDYDNMPDSLGAQSSQTEINAVATLIYHCGVSINTAYGAVSSSAYISEVDDALRDYFDYQNVRHVYKSVFTEADWLSMIKGELNQLRPVFYTGAGIASAHAFVCDGYDDQNYFHMNWGWGGYADGFFLLSNLSVNLNSYNTVQTAVINIVQNPPALSVSEEELTFFQNEGVAAEVQQAEIHTVNVEEPINLTVGGSFTLSLDSVNFGSQITLPDTGGRFYVKYFSGLDYSNSERENVVITTGFLTDSVRLVGLSYMPACNAPLTMSGAQGDIDTDTNQVMLTWQAPEPDRHNISWDSIPNSAMGSTSPYEVIPMHRLEEIDLLPYHNHLFTHISFIADPQAIEYRLIVYKGGYLSDYGRRLYAGDRILDQPLNMSQLNLNGWNTVALDTPIVIDASQELWYGVFISAPANSELVPVGGSECVPFKGNIYGFDFSRDVFWYPYGHNFVLKAVFDNPFVQYEVYRNDTLISTSASDTSYADYPPAYAHYTYEVQATWNNQCGSGVSQVVNFRPPCHVVNQTDSIYACDSYLWNDVSYTVSGDYLHEYWNEDECWQVDTLHLTIGHNSTAVDNIVACDSLTWINGITYTESIQGPMHTLTNAEQCDSVVTLNLTIVHSSSYTESLTVCDSLVWIDGNTYTETTWEPVYTLTNANGCDSVVTLHLTVSHSSAAIDSVIGCDSYTWIDGITYTESTQEPTFTLTNAVGCDSVVTLHLTILQSSLRIDTVVSCSPYTWIDGNTYAESTDDPTLLYENAVGCDSIVKLHLIMLQSADYIDTVVACDAYTWLDGNTYTETIQGPTAFFTDVYGCENATVTLDLTILHSSSSEDTVVACDAYTWLNGQTYTESTNEPTMTYTNAVGCDSVVTLNLIIYHSVYQVDERVACDTFTWINGESYSESTNTPSISYTSAQGCDSVVTLHLTVYHSVETEESLAICEGDLPFVYGDTVFDVGTPEFSTFNFMFSTYEGCDSLHVLHLTVNQSVETEEYLTIYDNELPYTYGDTIFDVNTPPFSTYSFQYTTTDGCDSIVTLYLTVTVGIDDRQMGNNLTVWPNPTRGSVQLRFSDNMPASGLDIRIYDIYGRLVQSKHCSSEQLTLDMSPYAQGVYILRVYQQNIPVGTAKISKIAN